MLELLSLRMPITTCALKIQESVTPMMTMVHNETFESRDGVRVCSIWRTRRSRRASWVTVANVASTPASQYKQHANQSKGGN